VQRDEKLNKESIKEYQKTRTFFTKNNYLNFFLGAEETTMKI
jgi:hypothetical protein